MLIDSLQYSSNSTGYSIDDGGNDSTFLGQSSSNQNVTDNIAPRQSHSPDDSMFNTGDRINENVTTSSPPVIQTTITHDVSSDLKSSSSPRSSFDGHDSSFDTSDSTFDNSETKRRSNRKR
uniref:Dentin sialophosphoprotein-like n=1 Tax=Caenorhabditis tropicalis TaxID=1561998 RepID=A0A1I7TUE0_9PELO